MTHKQILGAFSLFCSIGAMAQNDIDAMRYSQTTFGGTARFSAMAGSMGALGGDISSLSFNPAGIAVFRKTELTITPCIYSSKTSSTYNEMTAGDRKLNFNLGNLGFVASFRLKDSNRSGWESLNFGIGYNRLANFSNRSVVQGPNNSSSLLDTYTANAYGHTSEDFDGFSTGLAWDTYLINPDSAAGTNVYSHVITEYGQTQRKSTESKGTLGETAITFGGNYKGRVLLAASVGFVNAKYSEESVYEEIDENDSVANFESFTFTQNLNSKGSGINFKLGVIVKATDWLRVGAAVHTPTAIYDMKDSYSSTMSSDLENGVTYEATSPDGHFDYSITTPFRAIGSLGFIANKIGLLNIDYEYVDYSYAQLSSSPNVFADVNETIRSKYTSASNIRIGGEVRLDPVSFRLGYGLYGSPFKNGENSGADRSSYCAGLGFRDNNYFIDFGYVLTKYTESNFLYDPAIVNPAKNDYTNSSFMLTFGVRF
jgi:hypothetical protein